LSIFEEYLGKPWSVPCDPPNSFDCWEFAREIRSRLGLATPEVIPYDQRKLTDKAAFSNTTGWKQLTEPTNGCLVMMKWPPVHCGVYLANARVAHCYSHDGRTGSVRFDFYRTIRCAMGPITFWEMNDA
jgi:hypothetical protein